MERKEIFNTAPVIMIKRIEIKNYRSCLDTAIELHPSLSVLIGPNGSGKTNILNALLLLKKLCDHRRWYASSVKQSITQPCLLKVWFEIENKTAIFSARITLDTDDDNDEIIVSSQEQWYMKAFTGNSKRIKIPLELIHTLNSPEFLYNKRIYSRHFNVARKIPSEAIEPLTIIGNNLSRIGYYGATQFANPAKCRTSLEIEEEGLNRRAFGLYSGHSQFLFDLYKQIKTPNNFLFQQFKETIGPKGLNLIDDFIMKEVSISSNAYSVRSGGRLIKKKRRKLLAIPQFRIGKNILSPNQLSEGTFKTITLVFYLITEPSKILLIEEPEVCIHHGLLASILELIKAHTINKQIIISTHSDFVLDKVLPDHVYKVSYLKDEGTRVQHLTKSISKKELSALRNYLETEGNLGEYWKHGGLE